jgi:hypothetical protein
MSSFALRRNAHHIASIAALLNQSGRSLSGEATVELGGGGRVWGRVTQLRCPHAPN